MDAAFINILDNKHPNDINDWEFIKMLQSFVNYVSDEEAKKQLESQGEDTSEFDKDTSSDISTPFRAAKKGGVTKIAFGKDGGINIYMSHAFASNVLKSGITGGATIIGSLGGLGGATGAAGSQFINSYAGKAVPKNGMIMYGKPQGKAKYTFAPQ